MTLQKLTIGFILIGVVILTLFLSINIIFIILFVNKKNTIHNHNYSSSSIFCSNDSNNNLRLIFKISSWNGRLGNNLFQIADIIFNAKIYNAKVKFPNHSYLKVFNINFQEDTKNKKDSKIEEFSFTWGNNIVPNKNKTRLKVYNPSWRERSEIMKFSLFKQMLPQKLFQIVNSDEPVIKLSKMITTLTIHLRSGDLFQNYVHNLYWQPPLAVYEKIINHFHPSKIIIVTENYSPDIQKNIHTSNNDNKLRESLSDNLFINPCVYYLKEKYPNLIHIQSSDITNDMAVLLSAKNLVCSRSTFSLSAALMSEYLETIYFMPGCTDGDPYCQIISSPNSLHNFPLFWKHIYYIKLKNSFIKNWKNTKEQRILMLNFPSSKVEIHKIK